MTGEEERILDDLLEIDSGLYDNEIDFIESLDREWREKDLTEKQHTWLEKIWNRFF